MRPTELWEILATMPRLTASRASSLWLQWLSGNSLSSGCSQVIATIEQICSGVNVPGDPGRGASVNRAVLDVSAGADSQRPRQWRTVFGQTPSWRAISCTAVPAAASRIMLARSTSFCPVLCARASR